MKHARPDYDRIQDPAGLIPEDEPVFLLRAQDGLALQALAAYLGALHRSPGVSQDLIDAVQTQIVAFMHWPKKKLPDLPNERSPGAVDTDPGSITWMTADQRREKVR